MIRFRAAVSNPLALVAILIASTLLSPFASPAHAFHFPWDQGHDTFSPTTPPDPGLCKSSTCNQCKSSSSPVYVPTGHFVWSDTDIVLRGRPQMGLTRTYNSNDPRAGLFGNGWSVGCDVGLYVTTSGSELHFVYRAPDGKRYEYVMQPDGTVTSPPGRFEQILPQPDGTVQILYLDNTRQVFRADGRLVATLDANANRIDYSYDASDRLVSMADTNGRSLALAYNASGRVGRVIDHSGRVWQYAYDADANLVAVTDPLGGVRRYEYGVFTPQGGDVTYHQLTKVTDASGVMVTRVTYSGEQVESYTEGENQFSYNYNTATKRTTKTDRLGSSWISSYNDQGLITLETDPLGNHITRIFDANGRETSRTDETGAIWTSSYDTFGRSLMIANPLSESVRFVYGGSNPAPMRITSPSGRITEITYDSRLNPLTTKDASGNTAAFQWSLSGDRTLAVDPLGNQTSFTYNPIGLPVTTTDPLLRVSQWSYDAVGRPTTAQNAAGEVTRTTFDLLDRVAQIVDPLGNTTGFSYDAVGRLKSVTDANGNKTTFDYDGFGRLMTTTTPDGRVRRVAYRPDNLTQQITLPDLQTISYSYDAAKRLIREDSGAEVTTFSYSDRGELIAASGPGGSASFTYDVAGRLISETSNGQIIQSVLNNEGERVAMSAFGSTTNFALDARGLITSIGAPAGSVGLMYDAAGRRTQLNLPNSAGTANQYDAAGQLDSLTHSGPFSSAHGYAFDAAGRIVRQTGDGFDWQYSYDAAGRLLSATHGVSSFLYSYDGVGNILGDGRVHDSGNRLKEDSASVYTYDMNGSLVRKQARTGGARTEYSWNAKTQLVRVERFPDGTATVPTHTMVFSYDPLGRRASKAENGVVEKYVYDGADLVGVTDVSGSVTKMFTFGPGIDQPLLKQQSGSMDVFQVNHLGGVQAVTSPSGIAATYQYQPYGTTTVSGDGSNPFRYTAREQDAEDLYYYRGRYYDPIVHRFLSQDPMGMAGGVNAYSYAQGNPVSVRDPSGECPWCVAAAIGGLTDLGIQLVFNGFNLKCVDWIEVGISAAAAGVGAGIAQKLGQLGSVVRGGAVRAAERGISLWPSAAEGRQVVNGIEYTVHALERMAPVGLGGRGVPPSVVENAIQFGAKTAGNQPGTVVHAFENVSVVTNKAWNTVITVIKTGR